MSPLFKHARRSECPQQREQLRQRHPATDPIPTYQGRPLDRPTEDLEDQGLAFDLGTLMDRRRALGVFGLGAGALALAACGGESAASSPSSSSSASPSTTTGTTYDTEMPQETAGPYPGDGSNGVDVLELSGVERSDITTSIDGGTRAEGVPMRITMNIVDMVAQNGPMTGAAVYLWQADAQGRYSMYSEGVEDETYLRGVQVVGEDGTVTFTSIIPGCYDGRWPHLHFEVFPTLNSITDAANTVLTSQVAIPQQISTAVYADSRYSGSSENFAKVSLETDSVFSDGHTMQLPTWEGSKTAGYTLRIDVPIDTSTEPETSDAAPGGAPGGAGMPPAGGPGRWRHSGTASQSRP